MLAGRDIRSWIERWREADHPDSVDRSLLSRHYNGGSLTGGDCEGHAVNYLSGHFHLQKPLSELQAVYTGGKGFFDVTIPHGQNATRRRYVQTCVQSELNDVIRRSRRLRSPYLAACGDSVIYGSPFLVRTSPWDWCPKYVGKPWMPRDAPDDVVDDGFQMWAFPGKLGLRDLQGYLSRAGEGGKWRKEAIQRLIERAKKPSPDHPTYHDSAPSAEEAEYERQSGDAGADARLSGTVQVYWFFHKNLDKAGKIDVYCLHRHGELAEISDRPVQGQKLYKLKIEREDSSKDMEDILFYDEGRFQNIRECLFPFLIDCNIGGPRNMHRILGLGLLNFDSNRAAELMRNVIISGVEDDYMPLHWAANTASAEQLSRFFENGVRRGSILPADLFDGSIARDRSRNWAHAWDVIRNMEGLQAQNTSSQAGGLQTQNVNNRELEIVAAQRLQDSARAVGHRMGAWLETGDDMCQAIVSFLLEAPVTAKDAGWNEALNLRMRLLQKGILPQEYQGALGKMQRLPGGGDASLAQARAQSLLQHIQFFPPESQRIILRSFVATTQDDARYAEELLPESQQADPGQEQSIREQTVFALATGQAPPPRKEDLPGIHAPAHLAFVQGKLQNGRLDQSDTNGVAALLEHTMADIQLMAAFNPDAAKQLQAQAQEMAAIAQQMGEASAPPPDKDQHAMMMAERKANLSEAKQQFGEQKFILTQGFRQGQAQKKELIDLSKHDLERRQALIDASLDQERLALEAKKVEIAASKTKVA